MRGIALNVLSKQVGLNQKDIQTIAKGLGMKLKTIQQEGMTLEFVSYDDIPTLMLFGYCVNNSNNSKAQVSKATLLNEYIRFFKGKSVASLLKTLEQQVTGNFFKLKEIREVVEIDDLKLREKRLETMYLTHSSTLNQEVVVLDTSVFHKNPIILNDLIGKFSKIVLPEVVLRELNHQKDYGGKNIDKKNVSLILNNIRLYKKNISIVNTSQPQTALNNDDKIVEIAKAEKGLQVYLLTEDKDFILKCMKYPRIKVISLEEYSVLFNKVDGRYDIQKTLKFAKSVENKQYDAILNFDISNVDVDYYLPSGNTPLIAAVKNRDFKMVKYLVETCQVDINKLDNHKYKLPALTHAIMAKDMRIVQYLASKGADVNLGGKGVNYNNTPLMVAAWNGQKPMVEFLIKQKGICLNQVDSNGFTPLIKACINNRAEIVPLLVNRSDKYIRSFTGKTALDFAEDNMKKYKREGGFNYEKACEIYDLLRE